MFPTGVAGAVLLLLRASVATTFLVDGSARGVLVTSFWLCAAGGLLVPGLPDALLRFSLLPH
jgi:hypothetical protein